MALKRIALLSVHTSPLAPMGGKKTGGMNVYVREFAQELGKRGIQVDIFTRRTTLQEPRIDSRIGNNVRVIYISAGDITPLPPEEIFPHLSEFTARVVAFATRFCLKYDLIYSHYWLSGWVAQQLKETWGTPFVQMFHTLGRMKKRIVSHETVQPDQRIITETQIVQWADAIIAATPAERSQLLWLYRAKRHKLQVVPPGVNVDHFQPLSQSEAKAGLGFEPHHNILLFVGRIEPLKGVDIIVDALHLLCERHTALCDHLRFVIVGGDPEDMYDCEMQQLLKAVEEKELQDVVQFLGAKEQTELPPYYAAATAVLVPSDYESFGMVALEAMASGTPVIASEVGGLAFLVKDNETGYHIPVRETEHLADRIELLLKNSEKRDQMGRRASHLAQDYAWENIVDRLLAVFENITTTALAKTP